MTTPTDGVRDGDLREQLWSGASLKQALQDVVARHQTGYTYQQLKQTISDGEDLLDDEIAQVDKQVNILAHMFVFYGGLDRKQVVAAAEREAIDTFIQDMHGYDFTQEEEGEDTNALVHDALQNSKDYVLAQLQPPEPKQSEEEIQDE